jgi:hypothetical protein
VALALRAIFDGKLRVSRRPGEASYGGLMVDPQELRALAHPPEPRRELSLSAAAKRLGLPVSFMRRLVSAGVVRAHASVVPNTQMAMTAVEPEDVEGFAAKYVTLQNLALSLGRSERRLTAELDGQGVRPDDTVSTKGTPLYRRADVLPWSSP